jgi:hypothetical protein
MALASAVAPVVRTMFLQVEPYFDTASASLALVFIYHVIKLYDMKELLLLRIESKELIF